MGLPQGASSSLLILTVQREQFPDSSTQRGSSLYSAVLKLIYLEMLGAVMLLVLLSKRSPAYTTHTAHILHTHMHTQHALHTHTRTAHTYIAHTAHI